MSWDSRFLSLSVDVLSARRTGWTDETVMQFRSKHFALCEDIGNLVSLLERVNLMRQLALVNDTWRLRWRPFVAVDIEAFHFYFRSIMDHVYGLMVLLSDKPGQVGDSHGWGSYEDLLKFVKKDAGNCRRLGADLAGLVLRSESWFSILRDIRDEITHRGALTLVFGEPEDGVLFQVFDASLTRRISLSPFLMLNANVAYFDLYAACCFARLIDFLEEFALLAKARLGLGPGDRSNTWTSPGGLSVVASWMDSLVLLNAA